MLITDYRTVESFRDLQIRTQPQRFQVLKLVSCLLREWRHAVKDLGSFSVIGITDLVGGEKDPRNLMIVFSILQVVIFEFDIRQNTEVRICSCQRTIG
jgi:DNA repair/transcription protein MET18/MMS19